MKNLDRRVFAVRDDLAAEALRGQVQAARYAKGERAQIAAGHVALRRRPGDSEPQDSQLLRGDIVTIYERCPDGWVWVQNERDRYVGYLPAAVLADNMADTTHRVVVQRTFAYPVPDIKKPPRQALPLGAEVTCLETQGEFARIGAGEWVWYSHLVEKQKPSADFVAVAESMLGAPYFWGGNTPDGIDCSGLVQLALRMINVDAPRDSDMQEAALGSPLPPVTNAYERGDLIFWKGHVGIMCDDATLLHANGHHMLVVKEPLGETIARIAAKGGGPVTSARRMRA